MNSRKSDPSDRAHELDREIKRYRDAAELALGQLEWIVGYLHQARKSELAQALDRNRKQIMEEIDLVGIPRA
jgi:hypothetical protein